MSGQKIIDGLHEAIAHAKGDPPMTDNPQPDPFAPVIVSGKDHLRLDEEAFQRFATENSAQRRRILAMSVMMDRMVKALAPFARAEDALHPIGDSDEEGPDQDIRLHGAAMNIEVQHLRLAKYVYDEARGLQTERWVYDN